MVANFENSKCWLCNKKVKEQHAYVRESNKRYGYQPCPGCGSMREDIVAKVDLEWYYNKPKYWKDASLRGEYVACSGCVPAFNHWGYIWGRCEICHECLSKLKKNEHNWSLEPNDPDLTCGRHTHMGEHEYFKCKFCRVTCKGKEQDFIHESNNTPANSIVKNDDQELAAVQKQLAEVLSELKRLKGSVNGKDSDQLEQQIVANERLIKGSEKVSLPKVQEQINKSDTLVRRVKLNAAIRNWKVQETNKLQKSIINEGIGKSVILVGAVGVVLITGVIVVKKSLKRKIISLLNWGAVRNYKEK